MSAIANTTAVLASAVTNTSTFTVSYPTGQTQASLIGSTGGKVVVNGDLAYTQGSGFDFTFGSSNITVTNNTGATLAIGTSLILSFGRTEKSGKYVPVSPQGAPVSLTMTVGTASDTIADVGAAFNQTTLNNNMRSLGTKINAVLTALAAAGIIVS